MGVVLVIWGLPGIGLSPLYETRPPQQTQTLPMTFRHNDHFIVPCTTCHHEFVDGRQDSPCLTCHITDVKVAPLLEEQFHTLCRDCHVTEHAQGTPSGPTRRCISCHLPDHEF
ncbi:MAG: cytochrome c3 family protein [Paracoccus sp. (in: a-proteobacteria)]